MRCMTEKSGRWHTQKIWPQNLLNNASWLITWSPERLARGNRAKGFATGAQVSQSLGRQCCQVPISCMAMSIFTTLRIGFAVAPEPALASDDAACATHSSKKIARLPKRALNMLGRARSKKRPEATSTTMKWHLASASQAASSSPALYQRLRARWL